MEVGSLEQPRTVKQETAVPSDLSQLKLDGVEMSKAEADLFLDGNVDWEVPFSSPCPLEPFDLWPLSCAYIF